jgi:hypothetical protein
MAENVGTDIVRTVGFIEIADANNMVVIFPQVESDLKHNRTTLIMRLFRPLPNP